MPEASAHPPDAVGARSEAGVRAKSGRRGRRPGIEIKPGTVKKARSEAGLSLAQVAGGEVSRTAIYFVETGKAKPSMETLKLIAERTGRPLDYFLSRPSTLEPRSSVGTSEIERLIAVGDAAGALAAAEPLLGAEQDPEAAARIRFLMATAYLRLGQPVPARRLASAARAHFEQSGDLLMTAECLGSEASAGYLAQDPGALALAQGALATCRSLKPVPSITEARLLGVLAGVHATNHEWDASIAAYEQAIAAGEVLLDLRRLSIMYSGLSLAYQETGHLDQATHFAQRAMTIQENFHDRVSLARSENNLGLMLLRAGELGMARGHLERAVRLLEEQHVEAAKAPILLSLSELALAESRLDEAYGLASDALQLASRLNEAASAADAHTWLGRICSARGDRKGEDLHFGAAISTLESLGGSSERLSRAHVQLAEILEGRGDMAGAMRHLKLALAARPAARADSTAAIA